VTEDLLGLASRLFSGEARIEDHHPFSLAASLVEVTEGVGFVASFGNVSVFETGEGLVLVDTGSRMVGPQVLDEVRSWSEAPVHTAIFTHGHIDHVFGIEEFDREADQKQRPRPRVVAHEGVVARFERYRLTAGYNAAINRRQFQVPSLEWPTEFRLPDETFSSSKVLEVGGESFELTHGRGETDDHLWVWVPGKKVLCSGDFFIWASPNAGNPQKAPRYPREWAQSLRSMERLGAETLLPGHGLPVIGAERVRIALSDTAELLESLVEQTLRLMNEGRPLDEVIAGVEAPQHLMERPYLRPVYDEPEFVVRNLWRLYGGWYDGNPANLKPARDAEIAGEVAALGGGALRLAERAQELAGEGTLRLACHLAEMALMAEPEDPGVRRIAAEVYAQRAKKETSLMARSIMRWAAGRDRTDP
jgi:alkyl sulfatase BDS1-like metallo-beta-lactamase superfamily hydrolase